MPKYPLIPERCIEAYLAELERARRSERTIKAYRWTLQQATRALERAELQALPFKIDRPEIDYLLNHTYKHTASRTASWNIAILQPYLIHYGNSIIKRMRLSWPADERVHVDWLTPTEALQLQDYQLSPMSDLGIHLMLCLGLRRVELIRLRVQDLRGSYLEVRGKGKAGGKWRSVPYHPETPRLLEAWIAQRSQIVAAARKVKDCREPEELFIWSRRGNLSPYAERGSGWDKRVIQPVRDATGIHFGNHTLRRTFGRTMFQAGVKPETIAKLMGHESTATTIDYLGLNMDDMSNAMITMANHVTRFKEGIDD